MDTPAPGPGFLPPPSALNSARCEQPDWAGEFPRLFQLYSGSDRTASTNWFLQPGVARALAARDPAAVSLEENLQQLDSTAWGAFKSKATKYVHLQDRWGYSSQLFECLNEVKGYLYLKQEGYEEIAFVPEAGIHLTPDIRARLKGLIAIMEVKTVNESERQKDYFEIPGEKRDAVQGTCELSEPFKQKLLYTLNRALDQILADLDPAVCRRIVFFVIRLDFHVHTDDELRAFLHASRPADVEIFVRLCD